MILDIVNKAIRKFIQETNLLLLIWRSNNLRKYVWKYFSQVGELSFHKNQGRKSRESQEFNQQTEILFNNFGYSHESYKEKVIIDVGAGSKLRSKYFYLSKIIVIEPLAEKFQQISHCDLHEAHKIYSLPAENYIGELESLADLVVCINVLDHCFDEKKILQNIYKYLKQEGEFVLSVDLHEEVKDALHPVKIRASDIEEYLIQLGFIVEFKDMSDRKYTKDVTLSLKLRKQ